MVGIGLLGIRVKASSNMVGVAFTTSFFFFFFPVMQGVLGQFLRILDSFLQPLPQTFHTLTRGVR